MAYSPTHHLTRPLPLNSTAHSSHHDITSVVWTAERGRGTRHTLTHSTERRPLGKDMTECVIREDMLAILRLYNGQRT